MSEEMHTPPKANFQIIDELREQNAELVKALEPFAKLAALFDDYEIDRRSPEKDSVLVNVKLNALRGARAALASVRGAK